MPPEYDLLSADVGDDPEAYLAGDRRRALAAGVALPDRVWGAALFADLSGFTPLTEAMHGEYGLTRGAEQLTATLATIFDAVLRELHRHGGSVVYFSGDAITCWLDGDDGHLATACAVAMQDAMTGVRDVTLPSGRTFAIGLKVAVAVGAARRFVVGDPDIQLIDVLAGRLVDDLAAAEGAAVPGDVVLDASARSSLGDDAVVREFRESGGRRVGILDRLAVDVALPPEPPAVDRLPDEQVRPWLLPPVWERLRTGRGEFLAELRPAIPVFVRFGGIDFDDDPDAEARLDEFVVAAQRVIDSYGGAALQLTLGDKGAYLYAVFGSPVAHEDDASRACAAALDLLALEGRTAVTDLQIGVAGGRLRSGTYGHQRRRTFCCLGDAVNLAARLMSAAPPGQIVVADQVRRVTGRRYEWDRLPELRVKGKQEPVVAHRLLGAGAGGRTGSAAGLALVGRDAELATITELVRTAATGCGQVIGVWAEAGVGKSRLLAEVPLSSFAFTTYQGDAQSFGTRTSYFAWREVWSRLLGVSQVGPDDLPRALAAALERIAPDLLGRLPLLGPLLGIDLPDTDLTRAFDAKLRKASLESLLVDLLDRVVRALGPVAIVLEDCHWLDPLSGDLVGVLARGVADLPVVFLLAYRPLEGADAADRPWYAAVSGLPAFTEVGLEELDEAGARAVIVAETGRLFERPDDVPAPFVDLVYARAGGNPFHIQELVAYLRAQRVDPDDATALSGIDVPESLHALVLSRIDMLVERVRRTMKVGSVEGRVFDLPTVVGAYPDAGTLDEVRTDTAVLQQHDLVVEDDAQAASFLFRHAVIRDVAYDSLPFALRASLHERIARWFEDDPVLAAAGRRRLDLLAHHYWFTDNAEKKREYLTLAGDAAAADFANAVALEHYRRAVVLGSAADRNAVLVKLGRVQELVGQWVEAERTYRAALDLARTLGDRSAVGSAWTALAEVSRKQGRYDEATAGLREAEREFAGVGYHAGVGRVLHLAGTLAAQQGAYADARARYGESMEIRRRLGDRSSEAALLSNLAVVAEYEGDYPAARALNEQALELRRDVGERWALGVSHNNLGMVALLQDDPAAARDNFGEALRINLEVGDSWMVAIARNNLANAQLRLGDLAAAGTDYVAALTAYRTVDDRWALAILFEDIAGLATAVGRRDDALRLVGAADQLRAAIGSPRSETQNAELTVRLGGDAALIAADAPQLREAGGRLAGPEVDQLIRQVCTVRDEST